MLEKIDFLVSFYILIYIKKENILLYIKNYSLEIFKNIKQIFNFFFILFNKIKKCF